MENENILIEEEEDTQVTISEVTEYLNENNQENTEEDTSQSQDTKNNNRVTVKPTTIFEEKNTEKDSHYYNMVVPVSDTMHPISEDDKEAYLEAMLTESNLHLPIKMSNGITIVCRDLNMYERNLSLQLAKDKIIKNKYMPDMVITVLREIRLPMQIVKINNKPFKTIYFDYNADVTDEVFEADKKALDASYKKTILPLPSMLQSLYLKALNIFEHKLARLEEAAFNSDFWNPVGRV